MKIQLTFKNIIKRLKSPTPDKWRRLGEHMLNWSARAAVPVELTQYKWIGASIFIIGLIARGIVEFTTEDTNA